MTVAKKPQVMIAEDEEHSRILLKAILHSMNCEVVGEAKNGVEAVQLYKQLKPHLLLLDINMPLKTGEEVLQEIRSDFPNAFVIMVTSVSDLASIEQCLSLGAANFIRKDTPIAEIKTILQESWQTFLQNKTP